MSIDDVRARLGEYARGVPYGTREGRSADLRALLDDHERLRSLPVIPTCGDCCNSGIDDRTEGEVCKHDDATADPDAYPAIATTAAPPSWCPLRGKAGER